MRLAPQCIDVHSLQRLYTHTHAHAPCYPSQGIGLGVQDVPEWKKEALGKAPTFGIRDSRSIKDQRESLPIYKLREQLIQAVHDNQVCVGGGA